jgi:hypothetical protein
MLLAFSVDSLTCLLHENIFICSLRNDSISNSHYALLNDLLGPVDCHACERKWYGGDRQNGSRPLSTAFDSGGQ